MSSFSKCQRQAAAPTLCPVCGQHVTDITYESEDKEQRADFFKCHHCTFLFVRPVLIPELDSRQMDGLENAELFNSALLKKIYINYFIKKEIRTLRRAKGTGRLWLLDIGCGTGWTTKIYADQGFDVTGLEPSPVRADYACENYGIEVVNDYIENVNFDQMFDVVVLRHIIEHFADPAGKVKRNRTLIYAEKA